MLRPFRVEPAAYSKGLPEHLFSTNDIIIECEALTPHTRGSVSERILRLLPEHAVFINVGRGAVVDEAALVKIALEGKLLVGLDVYQKEPIPAHYPLVELDNALLSPHIAGPTDDSLPSLCEFALNNLQRYLKGEAIQGGISLEIYDRST